MNGISFSHWYEVYPCQLTRFLALFHAKFTTYPRQLMGSFTFIFGIGRMVLENLYFLFACFFMLRLLLGTHPQAHPLRHTAGRAIEKKKHVQIMKKRFTYRLRRVRVNAFFMIFCMSCQHSKSTFAIKRDIAKSLLVFEKKCLPLRTLLLNITPRAVPTVGHVRSSYSSSSSSCLTHKNFQFLVGFNFCFPPALGYQEQVRRRAPCARLYLYIQRAIKWCTIKWRAIKWCTSKWCTSLATLSNMAAHH